MSLCGHRDKLRAKKIPSGGKAQSIQRWMNTKYWASISGGYFRQTSNTWTFGHQVRILGSKIQILFIIPGWDSWPWYQMFRDEKWCQWMVLKNEEKHNDRNPNGSQDLNPRGISMNAWLRLSEIVPDPYNVVEKIRKKLKFWDRKSMISELVVSISDRKAFWRVPIACMEWVISSWDSSIGNRFTWWEQVYLMVPDLSGIWSGNFHTIRERWTWYK